MENSVDALRRAMQALIVGALTYLANFDLPVRQVMFPDFTTGTAASRTVLDARWALTVLTRNWESWPQFQAVLAIVKGDPRLSEIMLRDAAGNPVAESYEPHAFATVMSSFLFDYVEAIGLQRVIWDEAIFSSLYEVFANSIERGAYSLRLWTPIHNCDASSVSGPIELAPGISLVEPGDATRLKLLPTWSLESPFIHLAERARHYVCATEDIAFHRYVSESTQLAAGRVVSGIRLAVGGYAYMRDTRALPEAGSCQPMGAFGGYSIGTLAAARFYFPENPSVIRAEDIEEIRNSTAEISRLTKEFPVALTRFTSTTDRQNPADRLIDAIIGLENLLLQGIQDELAFRLALRGAWLLADAPSARIEEYKRLRRIYRARSEVVHGNPNAMTALNPEIVDAAVDSLRRVLGKVVTLGTTASEWKTLVDRVVFGSEDEGPKL